MYISLRLQIQLLVAIVLGVALLLFVVVSSKILLQEREANLMDSTAETVRLTQMKTQLAIGGLLSDAKRLSNVQRGTIPATTNELRYLGRVENGVTADLFVRVPYQIPDFSALCRSSGQGLALKLDPSTHQLLLATKEAGVCITSGYSIEALKPNAQQSDRDRVSFVLSPDHSAEQLEGSDAPLLMAELKALELTQSPVAKVIGAGPTAFVVATAPLEGTKFWIASAYPAALALKSVRTLRNAALWSIVLALVASAVVSLLMGRILTARLSSLVEETKKIAQGDLDVRVRVTSPDEVGSLGRSIAQMAVDLKKFIADSLVKVRMESELETAKLVQENLFPSHVHVHPSVMVDGVTRSASECSGDFWFRWRIEDRIYFMIADVTGHGVSAALITSAARSTVSLVEYLQISDLKEIVRLLNESVRSCSRGSLMMTAVIGEMSENGEVSWINCSHEAPLLLNTVGGKVEVLSTHRAPRLGDINRVDEIPDAHQIKIGVHQTLLFYTDGLSEAEDEQGRAFGVRGLARTAQASCGQLHLSMEARLNAIVETVTSKTTPNVADDMTLVALSLKRAPDPS